jgi:RNA polymerase sigma factor (sigma-70 family)
MNGDLTPSSYRRNLFLTGRYLSMNAKSIKREETGRMSPTDNDLMTEVRDGRVERLAVLFERYQTMLYNFFLRLTGNRAASEDLVQEVFVRVLKYRAGYLGDSRFNVWLFQIARNAHIDHLRKQKGDLPLDEQFVEAPDRGPLPDAAYEADREAELVRRALDRLPVRKREILVLFRFQNLKLREIAELLDCQVGTVKAQAHRALKDLSRIYLELAGGKAS